MQELRKCRKCLDIKDLEDFPLFSTAEAGRKTTCKQCSKELALVRKQLREQNPTPGAGDCPICKNHTTNWVLDHVHDTKQFRGYICNSCNLGLGKFRDDPDILKSALVYILN
jgi:protein-arginine kinase activator protein McsA